MSYLSEDVFEGEDGHLFLIGGNNDVSGLFREPIDTLKLLCSAWERILILRKQTAFTKGIRYFHCFIPDKISILREAAAEISGKMHFPAELMEENTGDELVGAIVPLTKYLRKQAKKYNIFHKTDTHWTIEGCFSAYQMLCYYVGLQQKQELITRSAPSIQGSWDLGSKLSPKRVETIRFGRFGIGATRVAANEIVTLRESGTLKNNLALHVGSIVEYQNDTASVAKLRLLVFGDSFFEYRPHMLTGMLAETIATIMFVWSSSIDWSLVDEFKPDIIVTEIAERFMRKVPEDNVDIRSHATKKIETALQNS